MSLSQDQFDPLLSEISAYIQTAVFPLEKAVENHDFISLEPLLQEKRTEVKARGWWLPQVHTEWDGMGLSLAQFGQVSEALGQSPFGHFLFNCQAPDAGNMEILMAHGTPDQQDRFLKPLLHGEIRSCFAMTEPEYAGSNPVQLGTMAVKDGEDYILNGHKWFTTAADGAAFAIVMAVTNPDAENPYARASQIIVPTDTPGYEFIRNIPVMGDVGGGYFSHAELRFDDCRVPVANRLGGEGVGFVIAQERLGPGRIHHCMRWIGICERAFDMLCRRAATRELVPGKALGTRQAVQHWIAECRARINAARLMVLDAARKIDSEGVYAARIDISIIKFFVADVLQYVLDRAIQVHGALGITDDLLLSHWYRHERGARIYDGADEVHKTRVARSVLKAYGLKKS